MAKGKVFSFYTDATMRRTILQSAMMVFLALLIVRLFAQGTFFQIPDKVSSYLTFGFAAYMGILLLFAIPDMEKTILFLWLGLLFCLGLSFCIHLSGFEYISNTVIFLGTLTILPIVKLPKQLGEIAFWAIVVYVALLFLFAPRFNGSPLVNLIKNNTNTSSIMCMLLAMMTLIYSERFSDWKWRIVCYGCALVCIIGQFQFGGRTSLIGTALFLIYFVFRKQCNKIPKYSVRWIILGVCIGSLVCTFIFLNLYKALGDDFMVLGKDVFSGREIIWRNAYRQLKGRWFFGIGNTLDTSGTSTTGSNAHNLILGYWTNFGVFAMILYMAVLALLVEQLCQKKKHTLFVLLIFLLLCYFETFFYSTGSMIYIPLVLLWIYQQDCREESDGKLKKEEKRK